MVGCRCPPPSTRRVLCAPRTARVAPRGTGHAVQLETSAADVISLQAALIGACRPGARWWTAWHRSADPVASAALPSRGPEAAASGPSEIGLRRRCTGAAVGTRRGVACGVAPQAAAEGAASRAALRWSTRGSASRQRRLPRSEEGSEGSLHCKGGAPSSPPPSPPSPAPPLPPPSSPPPLKFT